MWCNFSDGTGEDVKKYDTSQNGDDYIIWVTLSTSSKSKFTAPVKKEVFKSPDEANEFLRKNFGAMPVFKIKDLGSCFKE